jgi:hypothetical protein
MASDAAELSAILSTLGELERRLTAMARRYEGSDHADVLGALYEAERTLQATQRQVERAQRLTS